MEFINVKIGKLPGKIQEIALDGDRSVKAAIEAAELEHEGYQIRVNSFPVDLETELADGDIVLLVKKIKGN